ncbi:glycoside hydrolase [Clostridium sp. L74]|nr:glycoside hydrolase [Clostridium sp. L74]
MMAYGDYIENIKCENDKTYIIMKSGKKILYDDKKEKSFEEKIYNSDIQDMMEQIYPLETTGELMDKNFDPGRFRAYSLLEDICGNSSNEIQKNLKTIHTPYGTVQFNNKAKGADSLKAVLYELHGKHNNKINSHVSPLNGTFNYRHIAGTNLLSPHAFGIAIDLVRDNRDYWKWATEKQGAERLASYPKEIVETFEKNNFVWGGKWNHFDTLHFEYRPEIIMKAKYFGDNNKTKEHWYKGAPLEDKQVKTYIDKIDKVLK